MTVRPAAVGDSAWIVAALNRRRETLVQYASVFWRPARDAASRHRAFLDYLLTDGGAVAYRTDDSVLVAGPRGDGWLVDDFFVDQEKWMLDGRELWDAFSRDCHGSQVRFVCPAYEAPDLGCAAVVVNVEPRDADIISALADADFRRHCDYYEGVVGPA